MDSETIAAEQLQEKWNPILEHGDMPSIEDSYRKRVTAILLENQEKAIMETQDFEHMYTYIQIERQIIL